MERLQEEVEGVQAYMDSGAEGDLDLLPKDSWVFKPMQLSYALVMTNIFCLGLCKTGVSYAFAVPAKALSVLLGGMLTPLSKMCAEVLSAKDVWYAEGMLEQLGFDDALLARHGLLPVDALQAVVHLTLLMALGGLVTWWILCKWCAYTETEDVVNTVGHVRQLMHLTIRHPATLRRSWLCTVSLG